MGKIRVLDDHTANQIAAGEVVERPSSVVKELVENAVDAGSTRIDVSIEEGGIYVIRVTDNGSGMESDDCEQAFLRHATSKIRSSKDLFQIESLGFRGEALPSIAAVSRIECITSSEQSGLGKRIVIEGGNLKSIEDTAASKGSDIWVRDLFFNTPARLKYMKTIQTELGHVSDYMYRLALAYPGIAFTFRHNGNVLLQTLGHGDLLQVIAAIYGTTIAKQMISVKGESADFQASGFVSNPELTRANRHGISILVNGRYIKNYALTRAILQAYHTLLPINRFPLAVLAIKMDPGLIDVNVHPAKLEVRFSKEPELMTFLQETIREALSELVYIPQAKQKQADQPKVIQEQLQVYRAEQTEEKQADTERLNVPWADSSWTNASTEKPINKRDVEGSKTQPREAIQQGSYNRSNQPSKPPASPNIKEADMRQFIDMMKETTESSGTLPAFPELYPIGQLHGTYIVAQNDHGLYLIDQHAAHERINYEYYYQLFGQPVQVSQELLIPFTLKFTPSDSEIIKEKLELLEQVGVFMEHFGGHSFIVRSCPYWFPNGEEQHIVEEMTELLLEEKKSIHLGKLREKSAIMVSCKASIKANQSKTTAELEALLDQLRSCANPYTCPHGRPIVVSFTTYELEKMFKRVM
jgi:DNA mismatch repair protein MutL